MRILKLETPATRLGKVVKAPRSIKRFSQELLDEGGPPTVTMKMHLQETAGILCYEMDICFLESEKNGAKVQ